MAALKMERRVFLWNVAPYAVPKKSEKLVTIEEVVQILESEYNSGNAELCISDRSLIPPKEAERGFDKTNLIYIAEIKKDEDKGIVTLLINRGDPQAADPAFIAASKKVRVESPEPGESQGWSAHLVINYLTEADPGSYRACCESMPHLPTSLVEKFLKTILQRYAEKSQEFIYVKKKKERGQFVDREYPYSPALEIRRKPSNTVKNDLKKGELSQITLTKRSQEYAGPDVHEVVRATTHKMVLKTHRKNANAIEKFVSELHPWALDHGFDQIQFKLEKLPGNRSSSPSFDLEEDEALETLYVRAERLTNFKTFLERCYPRVCEELEAKMKKIVTTDKHW